MKQNWSWEITPKAMLIVMVMLVACGGPTPPPTELPPPALLRTLSGHTDDVTEVAFSPDGKLFASGSQDGTVQVRRVSDWALLHTFRNGSPVLDIGFSPDRQLLGLYTKFELELWRVTDGKLLNNLIFDSNEGMRFAFSPDGKLIAHGSFTGPVYLYNAADLKLLNVFKGHAKPITDLVFSPDGSLLASSAVDDEVRLWRLSDGILVRTLGPGAYSLAFSPDGKELASGGMQKVPARLWQVSNGNLLYEFEFVMWDLAYSPDGNLLAGITHTNLVELWNIADMTLWNRLDTASVVEEVAFSPDGMLLAFAQPNGDVQIWQVIH